MSPFRLRLKQPRPRSAPRHSQALHQRYPYSPPFNLLLGGFPLVSELKELNSDLSNERTMPVAAMNEALDVVGGYVVGGQGHHFQLQGVCNCSRRV